MLYLFPPFASYFCELNQVLPLAVVNSCLHCKVYCVSWCINNISNDKLTVDNVL